MTRLVSAIGIAFVLATAMAGQGFAESPAAAEPAVASEEAASASGQKPLEPKRVSYALMRIGSRG